MKIFKLRSCGRNRAVFLNITMVTVYKNNEGRKIRAPEFEHFSPSLIVFFIYLSDKMKSSLALELSGFKKRPQSNYKFLL